MTLKWPFSRNDAKIHSKVVNFMLITDLIFVFDLVWYFERILESKCRLPKALFSEFVSKIEL